MGSKLFMMNVMSGRSWAEISRPRPANMSRPGISRSMKSKKVASGSDELATITPRSRTPTTKLATESTTPLIVSTNSRNCSSSM